MPMLMTPLVLDRDVHQYDVSDSGLLIDVLIYDVYDADVEDVEVVVVSIYTVYETDVVDVVVVISVENVEVVYDVDVVYVM